MRGYLNIFYFIFAAMFGMNVLANYNTLPASRFLTFDDYDSPVWTHTGGTPVPPYLGFRNGTEHTHDDGWVISNARTGWGKIRGRIVPPSDGTYLTATNFAANLRNTTDAYIESPYYDDGIGTLFFDAVNGDSSTTFDVYVATNMLYGGGIAEMQPNEDATHSYNWVLHDSFVLNASGTDFYRCAFSINFSGAVKFKIVRTGTLGANLDDEFLVIDNIQVSYPPPYAFLEEVSSKLALQADFSSGVLSVRCNVDQYIVDYADFNNTAVTIWYRVAPEQGGVFGTWNSAPLSYVAGTGNGNGVGREYEGSVAVAAEGEIEYYYVCDFDGHFVPQDYTATGYNYPYPSESLSPVDLYEDGMGGTTPFDKHWKFETTPPVTELPDSRILTFDDYDDLTKWTHTGGGSVPPYLGFKMGTEHTHVAGWVISNARTGWAKFQGRIVPPSDGTYQTATNFAANLRNASDAYIESPYLEEGVGTLYFDAVNGFSAQNLKVSFAINMFNTNTWMYVGMEPEENNGKIYNWQPLETINLAYTTDGQFKRYYHKFNYRGAVKIRLERQDTFPGSEDSEFLVVDNIRISKPPTDVIITKSDVVQNPGYPNADNDFTVRCTVNNMDMNVPNGLRMVRLVHRWHYLDQQVENWQTNQMDLVQGTGDGNGNDEVYEGVVPATGQAGDIEYYYVCSFDGYVYESPDYTQTGFEYPYPDENLSPKNLRNSTPGQGEYSIRSRPYDSRYGAVYVVTDQHTEPIAMDLVGDHQWRGLVPLAGITPTNLTWSLMAEKEYLPGSESFETNVIYWATAVSQSGSVPTLPYGGLGALTNQSSRIIVRVTDSGYMEVNFNTETLEFLANRAEYQNFNSWPARDEYFSESSGQSDKQHYVNTFDQWDINVDQTFNEYFTFIVPPATEYSRDPFETPLDWVAGSAAYVSERTLDTLHGPPGILNYRNLALRLKGGDPVLGLGYVYNQVATLPDGLKTLKFKARIGQRTDNFDISYYLNSFTDQNYVFKADVQCGQISPENPSVSVVGYYSNPGQFYEFRVTQVADGRDSVNSITDQRIELAIYKWVNGSATKLGNSTFVDNSNLKNTERPIQIGLYNVDANHTKIRCQYATVSLTWEDLSSPFNMGTFGVLSSECASLFSVMKRYNANADGTSVSEAYVSAMGASSWFVPAGVFEYRASANTPGIYKVIPNQQLDVYVQKTTYSDNIPPPTGPGTEDWVLRGQITVSNFEYQELSMDFNEWQSRFVLLQVGEGGNDVAVDDLEVSSWHGKDVGLGLVDNYEWKATEAWVTNEVGAVSNHVMRLDHTRADPDVDQVVRSLLLENGMGMMEFDYRVLTPPAKLTVQYAIKGDQNQWTDVGSIAVSNVTDWAHFSAYLGDFSAGYFRVLNDRRGGYETALVELDNVTVWDEPFVNEDSWRSYNTKITSTDPMRLLLDESKGCFLNNSETDETDPTPLDRDVPNLQSPVLINGLGKLSFLARAYDKNQPATIYVYASTNGWNLPRENWVLVHQFDDIDQEYYKPYEYKPVDGSQYDAIRLESNVGVGFNRACVEEVVVSEPIYPGFDIVDVELLLTEQDGEFGSRKQPLPFEDVHVQARVANQQLSPSNIVMYVTYYVGDDVWGADNWSGEGTVTRRMHEVAGDPGLYRTRDDEGDVVGLPQSQIGGITGQEQDSVVQYRVWASYLGGIPLFEYQETFENPPWYYPVDLNVSRAAEGWSPYYFVYAVPPKTVWINEINLSDLVYKIIDNDFVTLHGIWENAYLEIAVPAWLDLGGWKVDLVTDSDYFTHTIQIPKGLPQQVAVTNGYAFFVIAEAIPPYQQTPALPKVDFAYAGLASLLPQVVPGGIRLRRPEGMYEQTIAFDDAAWNGNGAFYDGTVWAANDPEGRFVYVGEEKNEGSLSRVGQGDSTNTWVYPLFPEWDQDSPDFDKNYTPGMPNGLQWLPDGDDLYPGVSNAMINSTMSQLRGTQNGKRVLNYSLRMRMGSSTNITYDVDNWYRLVSVTSNGVEQLPPDSRLTAYTYGLNDIDSDVDIRATINIREDLADYEGNSSVINWVLSYPEAPLVPMFYNDRVLSLTEQYWLDANPTISNEFQCVIRDFAFDAQTNLHVRLEMNLNESNMTNIQGGAVLKLEAKPDLLQPDWDMIKQFYLTVDSFDSNNECHIFVKNPYEFILTEYDTKRFFMRWVIELDDPRISVYELENIDP